MRGGKEGKVNNSPMFPRLHVNDAERGGPRAPPRNKMALYEQLSIPSQRFNAGSASMLPLPPPKSSILVSSSSMSSSNGGGCERSVFNQVCNSPARSVLAEKLHSYSSNCVKLKTVLESQERKSVRPSNCRSFNAAGPLPSTDKSSSLEPSNFSNFGNFQLRKVGDEDDLRASSTPSGIPPHCSNNQQSKDWKFNLKKGSGMGDMKSRPCIGNQNDKNASQTSQDSVEFSTSIPLVRDKNSANASSSHLSNFRHQESLKRAHSSLNQENSSSMDILKHFHCTNSRLHEECATSRDGITHSDSLLMKTARVIDKENAFKVGTESCLKLSLGDDNSSPKGIGNGVECLENQNSRSAKIREDDGQDNVFDTSMANSMSALAVSPDDVVGVIGEKQFWKARRAIINQQRIFAVQVFELHRLLKVQKSIARTPNLLLEDLYAGKLPLNRPQAKKLRHEFALKPPPPIVKAKDDFQNADPCTEHADENVVANFPHPLINNHNSKGLETQQTNNESSSGNGPPASVSKNIKSSPWCFPPPTNQWLVSVMSPSEGLIYKPYTGPCPPTAGLIAPFYGSFGPVSLHPTGPDFFNSAYGVPASHQQGIGILPTNSTFGQTCFPPYGLPVINQSISGSSVDQIIPFPPGVDPSQVLCNVTSQMSRVFSSCFEKFQAPNESEVLGSTASSSSKKAKGCVLPLFPMEPTVLSSDQNGGNEEQQTRVIKVVPHNPRSATESAARIFEFIQEERKQYD